VFEPFFTTKRPGEEPGSACRSCTASCHSHGSGIDVKSLPNEGATFRIYLPPASQTDATVGETPPDDTRRGGEHVLIVDDELAIVTLLQRMLETRGYRVTSFTSSEEALASFRRDPGSFDAVVTDQTMPRLSGVELAVAIHAVRPDIPVLLTTGYVDREAHSDFGRDIADVIAKPFDTAAIARVLRGVLDRT
jgi:CheY-like chemotaxis protein